MVLADRNLKGAEEAAKEFNVSGQVAIAVQIDVADWESQKKGFEAGIQAFGRIDYVFPVAGITERPWIPFEPSSNGFVKPDLAVLDVNATGALYTCALAVQHFQTQKPNKYNFRGKGKSIHPGPFSSMPTIETAADLESCHSDYSSLRLWLLLHPQFTYLHSFQTVSLSLWPPYDLSIRSSYPDSSSAMVGFVRTYGRLSTQEQITINAVCPTIVKTGISVGEFYDKAEAKGLLVSVESLIEGLESLLGDCPTSGEAFEALPGKGGFRIKERTEYTNDGCRESVEMTEMRTYNAFKALREKARQ